MTVSVNKAPELSDKALSIWREMVEERLGLQVPDHRKSFLKKCLSIRMREIGYEDYLDYHQFVASGEAGLIEWNLLIDRLMVPETRFFRDSASYSLVKDHLKRRVKDGCKALSLWSVGCSTGEEVYSLAMTANEVLKHSKAKSEVRFGVTGTDISRSALQFAKRGEYSKRSVDSVPKQLTDMYFSPKKEGLVIQENLAERACFARLNLLELEKYPLKDVDIIYCQNVLIYFRKWRRKDIVTLLAERLAPGGMLVLGLGELVDWQHDELMRVPSERVLAYLKRN